MFEEQQTHKLHKRQDNLSKRDYANEFRIEFFRRTEIARRKTCGHNIAEVVEAHLLHLKVVDSLLRVELLLPNNNKVDFSHPLRRQQVQDLVSSKRNITKATAATREVWA